MDCNSMVKEKNTAGSSNKIREERQILKNEKKRGAFISSHSIF